MTVISTLPRPQPIGIQPLPTGYLLLPPVVDGAALLELLRGRIPAALPDAWEFYRAALNGKTATAVALLATDCSTLGEYNRFVLAGSAADYARLRERLPVDLIPFLDAAAFTMGVIDQAPTAGEADGELRAHLLLVQASAQIEQGGGAAALEMLKEAAGCAAESPLFRAQLLAAEADLRRDLMGSDTEVISLYRAALRALHGSPLTDLQSGIWLNLGTALQERGEMVEAAKAYQEALRFITRESDPEAYALAQNNLALTYLSAPMSEAGDQLRSAIAISALREALTVYTRQTHPAQWASTQLNLANALQYLPSSHPAENLAEAVRLYEDLYAVRRRDTDPLSYARLRANQGTALAHLGIFDHAVSNLREAQGIFRTHNESDAAATVETTLEQIAAALDRMPA